MSMLTFENTQHLGAKSIMEKLIVSYMTADPCPIAFP